MSCYAEYFRVDGLSSFVGIFVGLFSVLTLLYSVEFMRGKQALFRFYTYVVLTGAVSLAAVFADNLVLFIALWGFLGLLLYLLIGLGESPRASYTAKKAFIIIGGTDSFMLLGLALLWHLAGKPGLASLSMSTVHVPLEGGLAYVAYLCLAAGAFAKAGAMPFHTWVPDTAEDAPTPVTAFLPASLDKLLGIYFFARITLSVFEMTLGMNTFLMALGSVTIIAAVMMALVQHDLKRLLGYHAVSQVGYMILGIGTGTPLGIAGGLFHMLNNTLYKSCLFFSGGAVEKRAGTTDLGKLGGYARTMPISFAAFLIAALAISGVPPLNGFMSKWMIYQGVIGSRELGQSWWVLWLVAAMFGSALTLASFMKLVHAVFLGQPSSEAPESAGEAGPAMWIPSALLAILCILFGVFAYTLPIKHLILPALGSGVDYMGEWRSVVATVLILIGLGVGVVIYFLGTARNLRTTEPFVGGENLSEHADMRLSGVDFYGTVQEIGVLSRIYELAEQKAFDIYEVGAKLTFGISHLLGGLHNGALPRYLAWCLLGMMVLFYILSG